MEFDSSDDEWLLESSVAAENLLDINLETMEENWEVDHAVRSSDAV